MRGGKDVQENSTKRQGRSSEHFVEPHPRGNSCCEAIQCNYPGDPIGREDNWDLVPDFCVTTFFMPRILPWLPCGVGPIQSKGFDVAESYSPHDHLRKPYVLCRASFHVSTQA